MGITLRSMTVPFVGSAALILQYMRESGGSEEMAVNGSVTAVEFEFENTDPLLKAVIARTLWNIVDASPTAIKFGGITALTNGLLVELVNPADVVVFDFLDGVPIKQNAQFGNLGGVDWNLTAGAGTGAVTVRWSLFKTGREILVPPGFKIRLTVQDDLSALDSMMVSVQGYLTL